MDWVGRGTFGGCSRLFVIDVLNLFPPERVGAYIYIHFYANVSLQALRSMPACIADNAGYDSSELVTQLRAAHFNGDSTAGLDMTDGSVGNMKEMGIYEPLKLKLHVLLSAAEAAEMILRVDDIIKCAPRQRQQ